MEVDNSHRDAIRDSIAEALRAGKLAGLTVAEATKFGLTNRNDIRQVQHELRKAKLLDQRGNRFYRSASA